MSLTRTWQWARRQLAPGMFIFAFWTLLGVSFAGQFFIASSQLNRPISWQQALFYSLADWYVFAILSWFPIVLARRYGFGEHGWWRHFALHAAASVLFSLAYVLLRALVAQSLGWIAGDRPGLGETLRPLLFKTWHFNLLIYWVILTVCHALVFYRKYQERHARSLQLENRLVEARLQALQMQLNPHFLYNTLHAISSLMYRDVEAADQMISKLSHLLRYTLESTEQQEVSLRQEIGFLRSYLEIEQARFGDRLGLVWRVAPETERLLVPNLILQPLVENAIRYGVEPYAGKGTVTIESARDGSTLVLRVLDSGKDPVTLPIREGVGLSNTRARLDQLHGERQRFQLRPRPEGGLEAVIQLPAREVASRAAS